MNLLTALIPLGIAAITGGSGGETGTKEGMGLAESFLVSTGAIKGKEGMKGVQPFTAPEAARPRSVADLDSHVPDAVHLLQHLRDAHHHRVQLLLLLW